MSKVYSGQSSSNVVLRYIDKETYWDNYSVYEERRQQYYDDYEEPPEYPPYPDYHDFICQDVLLGGYAFGTVVSSGCQQIVSTGGSAMSTIVSAGGQMQVQGMASGTTILSGGRMNVLSGGTALGFAVSSGGTVDADIVGGGGAFISGTNAEGGKLLLSGGTASGFIVFSGGHLRLSSDGMAVDAKVYAGASLSISSGGAALETKAAGGRIIVATGGLASGTKLSAGSMLVAGTARDAVVSSGASLTVSDRGLLSGASILGRLEVYGTSARACDIHLSSGAIWVDNLGQVSGTIVYGGSLNLLHGTAVATTISASGRLEVYYDGTAVGTTVCSRARMIVSPSGTASTTTVSSGGRIVATGKVVDAKILGGGSLSMSGERASASDVVVSGGRMGLESGARAVKTTVSDGWQFVKVDGIASGTQVLEDGQQIVYAEGTVVKTTVSSGGLLTGKEGACLSCTTLKSGAEMTLASGNVLEGANAFTGAFVRGGTSSRPVRLAKGASLSIGTKMDMSKMHLKTAGASLTVTGTGNRLASLTLDAKSTVSFDISTLKAKGSTRMLSATTNNTQKTGRFSVTVVAQQRIAGGGQDRLEDYLCG